MLVIDRREDESAYAPGANRAEVQAEINKHNGHHAAWESTALPAQVEIEHPLAMKPIGMGVSCVTHTPGPEVLLDLLFKRVWGVSM